MSAWRYERLKGRTYELSSGPYVALVSVAGGTVHLKAYRAGERRRLLYRGTAEQISGLPSRSKVTLGLLLLRKEWLGAQGSAVLMHRAHGAHGPLCVSGCVLPAAYAGAAKAGA